MELIQTAARVRLRYLDSCPSTNTVMQELLQESSQLKPLLLVTAHQTAGRGRAGRAWKEQPGLALASSYFLPDWPGAGAPITWVPLAAGAALAQALQKWLPVAVKWPNDVLVPLDLAVARQHRLDELAKQRGGLKLAGILCEAAPGGVIIGAGINILTPQEQLPAGAASLLSLRAVPQDSELLPLADMLLASYVEHLQEFVRLAAHNSEKLRQQVTATLSTLGASVRAVLPDGAEVRGAAVGLGEAGQLLVQLLDGSTVSIAAADIEHLRVL